MEFKVKDIIGSFYVKSCLITGIFFFMSIHCFSQNESDIGKSETIYSIYTQPDKNGLSEEEKAIDDSKGSDAYKFMSLRKTLSALNAMILATEEESWINQQVKITDNLIQTAKISSEIPNSQSFKDNFKGWISLTENKSYQNEVPLYESYSFFYITQFLYILRRIRWAEQNPQNKLWWDNALGFIEKNIWTKWYERSYSTYKNNYSYFLRGRTHMGSHWAGIAMYLHSLTSDTQIQSQTAVLVQQYDTLLKRNLKVRLGGYVWNATYDNVEGTFAVSSSKNIMQDVSHGNHVVSYILAAYEIGNKDWTLDDVKRLAFTLKEFIYDDKNNTFRDNVDGSANPERPGWGNFVADGWVKLAAFDTTVKAIFQKFEKGQLLKKYNQELQYKANLYQIERKPAS